ncbi:20-hydroxyecdysone protein [Stomoxys calcitrans]|uniref:20-hydroxyecdysone protein n=1 Tax=Stomoxys calcitrans TaxID=35570 RepID=UPI0027E2C4E1|nr:20-hydroxyecdysone protein [Stomoxys calcitrans]
MRCSLTIVGFFLAVALSCDAAVVQRRYRNTEEVLVPVTVIQDGDELKEILKEEIVQPQEKIAASELDVITQEIAKIVDEEQKLAAVDAVEEAQRRFDEDLLEEDIKDAVIGENEKLLKDMQQKEEKLEVIKNEKQEDEIVQQTLKGLAVGETAIQPEIIPEAQDILKESDSTASQTLGEEKEPAQDLKSLVKPEKSEVIEEDPIASSSNEGEPEGSLRQATQATPAQTTQQNFVQQLIQSSPLGPFFNQITGQNNQAQVANDDAGSAPATPNPTIPAFLAPALTTVQNAAQSVVNTTTSAFQGLTSFASNLGNQFQNTLSNLGGQQPAQQAASDATTARPQGPFQQLVNTFMGNNQQAAQPAPQQPLGPFQGLLNIFQGNNANSAPQANTAPADTVESQKPAKEPEVAEPASPSADENTINTADTLSNEIRNSAEVEDSFEDTAQPEELIVVQDDATQNQEQQQ